MATHNSLEVSEKLADAPEKIQDFLASPECTDALMAIGEKYNLHIDQTGKLSTQVVYTIIGLENLSDFKSRIIKELGISDDTANLIIYDVNQNIFGPIRDTMLEMAKQRVSGQNHNPSPRPATTPTTAPVPESKAGGPAINSSSASTAMPESHGPETQKAKTIFSMPREEVDVKAGVSDNKMEPTKKITDPYHEPI